MAGRCTHLIGLLLGAEEDWPTAFEEIVRRVGTIRDGTGVDHQYHVERITVEPFDPVSYTHLTLPTNREV